VASFALVRQPFSSVHTTSRFYHFLNTTEVSTSQFVTLITLNCNFSSVYFIAVETPPLCVMGVCSLRPDQLFNLFAHQQVELLHTVYTNTLGIQLIYVYKCYYTGDSNSARSMQLHRHIVRRILFMYNVGTNFKFPKRFEKIKSKYTHQK
jgi:hypothetical protein